MFKAAYKGWVLLVALLVPLSMRVQAAQVSFEPGDVFVSLETGPVQWWLPDGTLRGVLIPTVPGSGEGMGFDGSGNLYVSRWRADSMGITGNTVEMFGVLGQSRGAVGRGFDCDPHAVVFDASGNGYVGQAGCRRSLLKFVPSDVFPTEFMVAEDNQGVFWMDLAPDACTMFYTSVGPNVKRFDTCAAVQLPNFNAAPLPGGIAHDLRVLPDGGVLVSSGQAIARLDASGALIQTYQVPGENTLWAGLDLVGDGTFWAGNYFSSNVYKFDLLSGAVLARFNTATPSNTVVGIRVKK
jgi:outer membrane protein assembly factor BamB